MKKSIKAILDAAAKAAIERRFGSVDRVRVIRHDGHLSVKGDGPVAGTMQGAAEFRERKDGDETLTELSFSSEHPVMRWGEKEVLLHDADAADFSRLLSVGAILKNHDPAQIVGVPVKASIDEKRRGVLSMRWGTTETAAIARKEALEDKTLRGVSVGYAVREWVYLKDSTENYRGIVGPAWVAVKWDALEASLTPIPADPSVGLGRMVRAVAQAKTQQQKTQEKRDMKKVKLLRAWKASDGQSYDAGQVLEVDERTFDELTAGEKPMAEAVSEKPPATRNEPETPPPAGKDGIDVDAIRKQTREIILAEQRAEGKRIKEIRAMCQRSGLSDLADGLVADGKTVEEAQREVLDKLIERQGKEQPSSGLRVTKDGAESFRDAAVDGLMLRSGVMTVAKPAAGANEVRGMSLIRLAEECLRRAGMKVPSDVRKLVDLAMRGGEVIAGTSSDFPLILANTANKSLLAGYEVGPATYPLWARVGSLNDFKAATRIKFAEVGKLKLVAEGGKYTETKRTESSETIQLGTYARMWTMSRQAVINDDLGAFTNTLFSFGMQARMLPNDLAIAVLNDNSAMTDGNELFSAAHGNRSAETDRRIDTLAHATAALIHAMGLMAQQKSYQDATEDGRYLGLRPKVWLVAMTDEILARQVVVSSSDAGQNNAGVANPVAGLGLTVVGDQNIKTSSTDYKHFLFADPRLAPVVEVAFLQGNQQPLLEQSDQNDADGRKWIVRLDCGAAAVDYVGAVCEVGTDD